MRKTVAALLIVLLLAACQPAPQPLPTPAIERSPLATAIPGFQAISPLLPATASAPTPGPTETHTPGLATIKGTLGEIPADWTGQDLRIYASPFTVANDGKSGFYILEPIVHPSGGVLADRSFTINNVPPGLYVLVGGPTPERALAILEGSQPRVYEVKAEQVLDLGEVILG